MKLRDISKNKEEVIDDTVLKKIDNDSYASKLKSNLCGSVVTRDNQNLPGFFINVLLIPVINLKLTLAVVI